jgi:hypothetical protein
MSLNKTRGTSGSLDFPTPGDALKGPELFRLRGKFHAGIGRVGRGLTVIS